MPLSVRSASHVVLRLGIALLTQPEKTLVYNLYKSLFQEATSCSLFKEFTSLFVFLIPLEASPNIFMQMIDE